DGRITIATGAMGADETYFTETYIGRGIIEDSYAYLEVSDNGCGMDAETQEKMFDPFFSTKFAGRGLGMSAVVGIVQGHDGMLKVDSRPGQGTTMRASFPCSVGQPSAISPADGRVAETQGLSGKVLVVDDEKAVLRVARKMLERMGLEVVEAGDGQEGVETFRRHKDDIACVLLDMSMPNMDGISCMAELRRIRPGVKVLMSSGYNEEEMIKRLEGAMPEGFLKKPYTYEALQQKLGEIMSLDDRTASPQ
ncbi:MAG: response regulator, partial [Mariprofundaceae bacterium]|nr:response regulator [Mariprofundaceae bacterium]